ncbi:MAG: hypothetical protein ACYTKD_30160 [Planctomycetota bacterium]|jgi:hypothetical protein
MSEHIKDEKGEEFHPPFIRHGEDIAINVTGEGPDGNQLILGEDVLVYFKLMGFEQGVLNRLRQYGDQNLGHDIDAGRGFIYLGDLEATKAELHQQIDNLFDAIAAHRHKEVAKDEK